MVDKREIKVPKSRNYLTEWPFVPWPFVGGLMSGWPLVRTPRGYTPYTNLRFFLTAYTHLSDHN